MKVVAFNGSPRKDGNTSILVRRVFAELEKADIATELVSLAGERPQGCIACYQCWVTKDGTCAIRDDCINDCIAKIRSAAGIILASPTYFADVTTELKALIDRAGMVAFANDSLFRRKVGAGVVAVRRSGAIHAFDTINNFFLISQMVVPGSKYWNVGFGQDIGDVEHDEEGILVMKTLGENMAWLLKAIARAS